jgi:hypothetical protein
LALTSADFLPTELVELANPYDVTNLVVTNIAKESISLSWSPSVSSDVSGYDVYDGTNLLTTVTETSAIITGLTADTNYTFTVKAIDPDGNSSYGVNVSTKTLGLYKLSLSGTTGNYLTLDDTEFSSLEFEVVFKTKLNSWNNHLIALVNNPVQTWAYFQFTGLHLTGIGDFKSIYVNGTKLPSAYNQLVPLNPEKIIVKISAEKNLVDDLFLFAKGVTDQRNLAADIYNIKTYKRDIYGVEHVVSTYDFTTIATNASVPDFNGVGNPIIINGGSFTLS